MPYPAITGGERTGYIAPVVNLPLLVFLVLGCLGLLLQSSMGLLLALKRPMSPLAAIALPLLLLLCGTGWSAWQAESLHQQALEMLDEPDLSNTLLNERVGVWEGVLAGGLGSTLLVLPLLMGAAVGSLRAKVPDGKRRSWMPTLMAALAAFPGPVVLWMGMLQGEAAKVLAVPGVVLPLLLAPGVVGLGAPRTRPLAASGLLTGLLGLLMGSYALLQWWLPEDQIRDALLQHQSIQPALNLGLFASAVAVLPGWLAGATNRSSLSVVAAPLGTLTLQGLLLLPLGFLGLRLTELGRIVGMYEVTISQIVPEISGAHQVPMQEGLPGRVLVATRYVPHWIARLAEGVSSSPLSGDLIDVGPSLQRGDGLLVPAEMNMGDFYLMISGTNAGELSLVGCRRVEASVIRQAMQDPLLSTGWCGSTPLRLRLGLEGRPEREYILLKEKQVDDNGEIRSIASLTASESVLLRVQVDATVGDLQTFLAKMPATKVYLGWGVQLDGEDLPVGVE